MLKGVNDSVKQAKELVKLVNKQLCHINLIPYNATGVDGMAKSEKRTIEEFAHIIKQQRIPVTIRMSLGQDIDAACGQLANKKH
jgi:23S rRNA (adenine2503-C2)-methyltransferase